MAPGATDRLLDKIDRLCDKLEELGIASAGHEERLVNVEKNVKNIWAKLDAMVQSRMGLFQAIMLIIIAAILGWMKFNG